MGRGGVSKLWFWKRLGWGWDPLGARLVSVGDSVFVCLHVCLACWMDVEMFVSEDERGVMGMEEDDWR